MVEQDIKESFTKEKRMEKEDSSGTMGLTTKEILLMAFSKEEANITLQTSTSTTKESLE